MQVKLYKDALSNKFNIQKEIKNIKDMLKTYLINNSSIYKDLVSKLQCFVTDYGDNVFDMETPFGMEMIKIIRAKQKEKKAFRFQPILEQLEPKELDKEGQKLLNTIYADFKYLESVRDGDTFDLIAINIYKKTIQQFIIIYYNMKKSSKKEDNVDMQEESQAQIKAI